MFSLFNTFALVYKCIFLSEIVSASRDKKPNTYLMFNKAT